MNIAFIPLRCGSKSIPFKNIKTFCGKPLAYWNIKALQNSTNIDKIYVATDCTKIETVIKEFNFSKVEIYKRSYENAKDQASTESVMLEFINNNNFNNNDLFFLVQATSPLTQTKDFDSALDKIRKENADSLLTCVQTKNFFWNKNGTAINYNFKQRPRRQDFIGLLMENGAFYINTIGNIKKYKNRISGKIVIYKMPEYTFIELDEEDDWFIAESLMKKYIFKNKTSKPKKIKLFISDVDGTLTNAGMYYSERGDELKKFNTRDGKGFELLRKAGIKTAIITSENTKIVEIRAKKLKIDYLYQGLEHVAKLDAIRDICKKEKISLEEVAFIGDDINDKEVLESIGLAACPLDAMNQIKQISNIKIMSNKGGEGAVREFVENVLNKK